MNLNASLEDEIINRIAKAINVFGKLWHHLWDERGISLRTKIGVYIAVVLTTLLYGSESWPSFKRTTNSSMCSINVFHKLSNADLLAKCKIGGIETFLLQSQLKWAGHVIRISDNRIHKILMYSQLSDGKCNVARPLLWYKDKLKGNLRSLCTITFEQCQWSHGMERNML